MKQNKVRVNTMEETKRDSCKYVVMLKCEQYLLPGKFEFNIHIVSEGDVLMLFINAIVMVKETAI